MMCVAFPIFEKIIIIDDSVVCVWEEDVCGYAIL